jgi:hypothetical protein
MNMRLDDFPHTGAMGYGDLQNQIIFLQQQLVPMVLSYSKTLKANPNLKFYFKQSCQQLEDVLSYNVVERLQEQSILRIL